MRILVLIVLIALSCNLYANNYYLSSVSGDDSRSISEAQNSATPWRTIAKLNSVSGSLKPGDIIYFKTNEVFDGSIQINVSGTSGNPITFTSYGGGTKPVINGFSTLSNWTSVGNNTWEAQVSFNSKVNALVLNGTLKEIGRYPNSSAANKGYLTIESSSGNAQITSAQLAGSPNWNGGDIVIRKNRWITDRNTITGHSGNTIYYNSESGYPAYAKFGFFVENHPSALDVAGEWYYKTQEKKVGLYYPTNPNSSAVQVSTVENLVSSHNQSYIVFDNLSFQGANTNAFDIENTQGFRISNCEILYSGVNAINALNTNNVTLENSLINHTNNNAFNAINCSNTIIRNNKIKNTAIYPGMGKGGDGNFEAIVINGDNETIELNEIDSTGYVPITFRGNDNLVKNNFINHFTLVKDDGGGIYTWNNIAGVVNHGNKVIGNIVVNGVGAGEGTEDPDYLAANGIYMDDGTANAEIIGNTVANCGLQALYLHNAHEIKIENNTFFDSRKQVAITRDNFAPNSPVRNLRVVNNIIFSKEYYQPIAELWTDFNDIAEFGYFDSNYYCRPADENSIITVNSQVNGTQTKFYNLEEWRAAFNRDIATKKTPIRVPTTDFIRFEYNATTAPTSIALDGEYVDVKNNNYSGTVTLQPFSSVILLKKTGVDDTEVPPSTCAGLGTISREQWNNVAGFTVNDIPLQKAPDSKSLLTSFEGPTNIAENYASRIRGYICPPKTGNYTFWIASDDQSELWLSTDDKPENKQKIAVVVSWTNPREWYKYPSQKSAKIALIAGVKYYIEALHKEAAGGDNISVAWQFPNGVIEAPIAGNRLAPFDNTVTVSKNNQSISFSSLSSKTFGDAPFAVNAVASSGLPVSFRIVSGPASIFGNIITLSNTGTVVVEASQTGDINYNAAPPVTQSFTITTAVVTPPPPASACPGTGSISYEQWNNLAGNNLDNLTFLQTAASSTNLLSLFEGPTDAADSYASRIRGYVCPPISGNFIFWISGDDASELWLSTDDNPANKVKIASILSWTFPREWNKFPSQKSVQIYLHAGQRYYIEALHKEGGGGDNLAVAWQLPNGTMEAPISGSRLFPYTNTTVTKNNQSISFAALPGKTFGDAAFTINATASSGLAVSYRVVSGPANLAGNTVTLTGVGTVVIEASQTGNVSFNAAPVVTQSFAVSKSSQTINFLSIGSKTFGDAPFAISATASSGLPVSFRIVSGPASISGNIITLTNTGTVIVEASQAGDVNYNAAIVVTQSLTVTTAVVTDPPPASLCPGTGSISYDQWNNLGGNYLDNLAFLQTPESISNVLTLFEGPTDVAENYASRIRGYVCPPISGNYIFWVSGDDASELWLSTDDNPQNKVKIASVQSWTSAREWNKFPSQKSVQIYLQAGQRYYIEALHKEGGGGDNLAVAWQLPNGLMEAPISGSRLSPYTNTIVTKNNQTITFAALPAKTFGDAPFSVIATASSGLAVSFRVVSGPATILASVVTLTGVGTVVIEASQVGNNTYNAAAIVTQSFAVGTGTVSITPCSATGSILREKWDNLRGPGLVTDIPVQTTPTNIIQLSLFESQRDIDDNYGLRIRGYICPPQTGSYVFWVSGDEAADLYLSTDDNAANKTKIAGFTGGTSYRQWNKYASQQSVQISLVAGQRYYIEALLKERNGEDHLSVAWQLPNGTMEAPIGGNRLSPYQSQTSALYASVLSNVDADVVEEEDDHLELNAYPNPFRNQAIIKVKPSESGITQVAIFDLQGRMMKDVFKGTVKKDVPIHLILKSNGLAEGVYTIRLTTGKKVTTKKIVLVK